MSKAPLKSLLVGLMISTALLGGCASRQAADEQAAANEQSNVPAYSSRDERDPLEPINRAVWDFNWNILDRFLLRPVTVAYVKVMPQFARTGLVNAANNLEEPGNMFNNMLQGKVEDGFDSAARFILNSTVGLLGTIDVAGQMGIERKRENFGEVLGSWGVGTGPFIMLPVLGPSDPRSFAGDVVDSVYYPMSVLPGEANILRIGVSVLEGRAALMGQEAQLEQAVDDYAFIKNAYFQNLEFRVTDGASAEQELDDEDFEDFEDFEDALEDLDGGNN